ncbi:glycerophosphodiester phosphodiesterase family protein [Nocardioides yefusunii]|uniref:Glycerophosphodiester phosphodiesterase family protein n=1 Tax=Nocardioides yefusunii TaxID=2500546 RepID=A0ABW1QV41_9ACTN|nr:glycerophosphodiester phosphodiesterase family protein [Nocardioides yefusunii]
MSHRTESPRAPRAYLDADVAVVPFAHRGGAHHPDLPGLENSLAAFTHAHGLGYRYLETDVHVTADGVLVAFHDSILDRVTNRTGAIAQLSHREVQQALIGGREPIPTFAELLAAFPDSRFNVDLKADGAVEPLVAAIEAHGATDRVLVGSFSRRRLRRFRRLTAGRVATSAHPLEVVLYRLLPGVRVGAVLARWLTPGRPDALQVPHRRGRITVVTPGLVARAHTNGLHVHVWTIDDPDEMAHLVSLGVDGIMTDRTDLLVQTLTRLGLWKDPA